MARKQTAILSINRGVATLNGMVVERVRGEDPHQTGIRAVIEQLAAPSRRAVQVVATDDAARIRMYVHPDGEVSDIETLDVFGASGSGDADPADVWIAAPPRQMTESAEAAEPEPEFGPEFESGPEPEVEAYVSGAEPVALDDSDDDMSGTAERPRVEAESGPDDVADVERTAERPKVVVPPEPSSEQADDDPAGNVDEEPEPVFVPVHESRPTSAPPRDADSARLVPVPPPPRTNAAGRPYGRGRVTARGRVVLVVAAVVLLIVAYSAIRAVRSMFTDESPAPAGQTAASASPSTKSSAAPSSEASYGTVPGATLAPSSTPTPTPKPTATRTAKPQSTEIVRTLTVKAISQTEAIELRITATHLPVTATIRMDPWGVPEPFTTRVRLTEPNQSVMIKPVASGHAAWSVEVDGAKTVRGYTHSWPKGKRVFVKK